MLELNYCISIFKNENQMLLSSSEQVSGKTQRLLEKILKCFKAVLWGMMEGICHELLLTKQK